MNVQNPALPLRVLIAAFGLIAVGALAVSVVFVVDDQRDDRKLLEQRAEARVATCEKDVKFAEAHNRLVVALATADGTREIPPALQPRVDNQLVTVPDCTPEGLERFYGGRK